MAFDRDLDVYLLVQEDDELGKLSSRTWSLYAESLEPGLVAVLHLLWALAQLDTPVFWNDLCLEIVGHGLRLVILEVILRYLDWDRLVGLVDWKHELAHHEDFLGERWQLDPWILVKVRLGQGLKSGVALDEAAWNNKDI